MNPLVSQPSAAVIPARKKKSANGIKKDGTRFLGSSTDSTPNISKAVPMN